MAFAVDQSDLTVAGITWTPTSPVVGNAVTFSALVKNLGDGSDSGEYSCQCGLRGGWDSCQLVEQQHRFASEWGGLHLYPHRQWRPNGTSTWNAFFGNHAVNAWVDDANQIAELNENNNQFSTSISVGAPPGGDLPDLIVTDLV